MGDGPDSEDKWYLTNKADIEGMYGFREFYSLPKNANLSEAYFELKIDVYQGEKIDVTDFGTLIYSGIGKSEFNDGKNYYVYKNSLNNLKKLSKSATFKAKGENGYTYSRGIYYGYQLSNEVQEETVTGTINTENKDTKIKMNIVGNGNAKFKSIELQKNDTLYVKLEDGLKETITDKYSYIDLGTFDISVVDGAYTGKLKLTFDVGTKYNGKDCVVGHLANGLNYESFKVKVVDGKITVTVNSLSPFMIAMLEEKKSSTQEPTPTPTAKVDISKCNILNIPNQNYTGKEIKPKITVKNGNVTLKNNIDYTVSYKSNKNLGTATVIITGKGNYSGTVSKTFKISVGQTKKVNTKKQDTKSITIKWNRDKAVSGYEIYMSTSKNKGYKKDATIKKNITTSYKKTKLSAGKTYYFKVRAYKTVNKKKKYGAYSGILTTTTKTKAPTISKVTAGKKKATVKWKKVSGATGYEVYMSTSKSKGYKKIATNTKSSKVSYTKSKLKKNKRYYFKVRTYKTVNGKKIYSSYSSAKSIRVK